MIKQETWVWYLSREGPLEKEMATHSSILAGKTLGQRNLVGCILWCHKESTTTETNTTKVNVWWENANHQFLHLLFQWEQVMVGRANKVMVIGWEVCKQRPMATFFFIFTLFYFTILYWFCHTLTWIDGHFWSLLIPAGPLEVFLLISQWTLISSMSPRRTSDSCEHKPWSC